MTITWRCRTCGVTGSSTYRHSDDLTDVGGLAAMLHQAVSPTCSLSEGLDVARTAPAAPQEPDGQEDTRP